MCVSQCLRVCARLYMFTFVAFIFTLVIHNSVVVVFYTCHVYESLTLNSTHREREKGGWGAGRQTDRQSDRQAGRETALQEDKRQ